MDSLAFFRSHVHLEASCPCWRLHSLFSLNLPSSEPQTFIKVFSSGGLVEVSKKIWYWNYYRDFLQSLCFCQQRPSETRTHAPSLQSLPRQMTKGRVEGLSLYSFSTAPSICATEVVLSHRVPAWFCTRCSRRQKKKVFSLHYLIEVLISGEKDRQRANAPTRQPLKLAGIKQQKK